MAFCGSLTDHESRRDLVVREPFGDEMRDLVLAAAQRRRCALRNRNRWLGCRLFEAMGDSFHSAELPPELKEPLSPRDADAFDGALLAAASMLS